MFKRQDAGGVIRMVQYPWVSTNFLKSITMSINAPNKMHAPLKGHKVSH